MVNAYHVLPGEHLLWLLEQFHIDGNGCHGTMGMMGMMGIVPTLVIRMIKFAVEMVM